MGSIQYTAHFSLLSALGIAVDSEGSAWIVGTSCNIKCTYGTSLAVRKLDASGVRVLVSLDIGGAGQGGLNPTYSDSANAVAVAADDSVWIVGEDQSGSIPTTTDAIVPTAPTDRSGYAMKLNSSGHLLYATYIGSGYAMEPISTVALDGFGNPYFTLVSSFGSTSIIGARSDGSALLFSQQFPTVVGALALDGNGGLFVAGIPEDSSNCPTTPGAYMPSAVRFTNTICAARFDLYQSTQSQIFYPLSAASQQAGSVAPGELVTIHGQGLPQSPIVTFDGLPAPLVYSDSQTITAAVPFGINSGWTTLNVAGVGGYTVGVWPNAPGLLTADGSGAGQLQAVNADGSANSAANPAPVGSTVTLLLTGAGAMSPVIADGSLGSSTPPFATPVQAIYALVNGVAATGVSAIQAPGLVAGVIQLQFQIPTGTAPGDAVVQVNMACSDPGCFPWQPRTTIAVQ